MIELRKVKNPKRKRLNNFLYDDNEAMTIYTEAAKYTPEVELLVGFMLFRGVRISEGREINVKDFSSKRFDKIEIILCKSKILDEFPIAAGFSKRIEKYIQDNSFRMKNGYLFPGQHGGCWTLHAAEWAFLKFRAKLEKKYPQFGELYRYNSGYTRHRVTWHTLRRWFETKLLEAGLSENEVADIMRYSSTRPVRSYWNSYKTWKKEREIIETVFGDFFGIAEKKIKGQSFLTDFGG